VPGLGSPGGAEAGAPKMTEMPKGSDTTEGPVADHGEDQVAGAPHADIIERLLGYQRLLRKETGWETATSGGTADDASSMSVAVLRRTEPEARHGLRAGAAGRARPRARGVEATSSEASDARQLKDRLDRLDETVARISAMRPLLNGERDGRSES